jgi:diguanylate cyclase (GGDEF)-like protein
VLISKWRSFIYTSIIFAISKYLSILFVNSFEAYTSEWGEINTHLSTISIVLVLMAFTHYKIKSENIRKELKELTLVDPLTGLYNRRYYNILMSEQALKRERNPLYALVIDIDFFKKLNDTYGHDFGDYVLKKASEIFKENVRPFDDIVRMGGEEFLVILRDTEVYDAINVAERLRNSIEECRFIKGRKMSNVTISIGVAKYKSGDSADELFEKADIALYQSKENGRNRVTLFS